MKTEWIVLALFGLSVIGLAAEPQTGKGKASREAHLEQTLQNLRELIGQVQRDVVKGVKKSDQSVKELEKTLSLLVDDIHQALEEKRSKKGEDAASAKKRREAIQELRRFVEDLGADVMKQVDETVKRLNEMSESVP